MQQQILADPIQHGGSAVMANSVSGEIAMGPDQSPVGGRTIQPTPLQQVEKTLLRLSAVNSAIALQPLSMTIANIVGPAQVSTQIVDAVRAAQATAQAITVAGSDKSSGLPHPQVKRQAAGGGSPRSCSTKPRGSVR